MSADKVTAIATIVGAAGTVISAIFTAIAAGIAANAAKTWRDNLRNQAADDCVRAARELRAAINRVFDLLADRARIQEVWAAYNNA